MRKKKGQPRNSNRPTAAADQAARDLAADAPDPPPAVELGERPTARTYDPEYFRHLEEMARIKSAGRDSSIRAVGEALVWVISALGTIGLVAFGLWLYANGASAKGVVAILGGAGVGLGGGTVGRRVRHARTTAKDK